MVNLKQFREAVHGPFVEIGDKMSGRITAAEIVQLFEYDDDNNRMTDVPRRNSYGTPIQTVKLTIATDAGEREITFQSASMRRALDAGTRKARVDEINVGDTISVTFTGTSGTGQFASKNWLVEYQPGHSIAAHPAGGSDDQPPF
jgi:hypothetical protein